MQLDSLVPLFPFQDTGESSFGVAGVIQAVSPQQGESNDLGAWTWLSSRSTLTLDLEPFLILFLR